MAYYKQIAMAGGTLVCAVGIGFIMQNSDTAESRYGAVNAVQSPVAVQIPVDTADLDGPVLDVHDIILTSALDQDAPDADRRDTVVALGPVDTLVSPDTTDVAPGQSCSVTAVAKPSGLGLVDLTVTAPCFANERLTVHHSGMRFTETTDATGALDLSMPVLADPVVIVVAFANGDGAVAQTDVPSLNQFDRAVLQWKGDAGFQIHAREFGADYGTQGDIWAESPGDPVQAISGEGGFLMRLGDQTASDAMVADVYTYPSGASRHAGVVDLSAEIEVSLFNCGLDIEAQSLEVRDGDITTRNLDLTMPGCDTIGSFLVLNNLIQDLKVAQK